MPQEGERGTSRGSAANTAQQRSDKFQVRSCIETVAASYGRRGSKTATHLVTTHDLSPIIRISDASSPVFSS